MTGRLDWFAGIAAALAVHGATLAAVSAMWRLDDVPQQDRVAGAVEVSVLDVPEHRLSGEPADGAQLDPEAPDAGRAASAEIRRTEARPVVPVAERPRPVSGGERIAPVAEPQERLGAVSASARPIAPSPPPAAPVAAVTPQTPAVAEVVQSASLVTATTMSAAPLSEVDAPQMPHVLPLSPRQPIASAIGIGAPTSRDTITLALATAPVSMSVTPNAIALSDIEASTEAAVPVPALSAAVPQAPSRAPESAALDTSGPPAQALPPTGAPLSQAPATGAALTAALAWSGGVDQALIGDDLDLIETLLGQTPPAPGNTLRDDIAGLLAGLPCARLHTVFLPDAGALELRGHVPDPGLVGPLVAALQTGLRDTVPVRDNLRILPSPQCDVLSGVEALGLPQSTDQFTNPALIGEAAHVREFRFSGGQDMVLDVRAPDYPAYVYVDYYAADGMVLHLTPSKYIPLLRREADEAFSIGGVAEGGGQPLKLVVSPPFGQEIALALAVSEPLYTDARPFAEPAAEYLAFLAARVAALRAESSAFRGEWIYFFISTRAPG